MKPFILAAMASVAAAASPRYVMYFDQYHTSSLPNKTVTAGINYVITAFANSTLFTTEAEGEYEPFMPLDEVRAMFDEGTKVCMAIGGWGDTDGFSKGAQNCTTQTYFAKKVAETLDRLGYDCVDVDWEFPGGNGADYIQHPNSEKVSEIHTYAELLGHIKEAIGDKELSIAVPGLEKDMIAFTYEQVPKINAVVDFVNVMTYDLMSRRDNVTNHHTSVARSLHSIETYAARGMSPLKMNLGFAFYAKFFITAEGAECTEPIGCPTVLLEAADGSDTGMSGVLTFEAINFAPTPTNLTDSPDMTCGAGTFYKCPNSLCCSQYNSCGSEPAYCGAGCQSEYGVCEGPSTRLLFQTALANEKLDVDQGGEWYWDSENDLFWTWDTPELITRKFNEIVVPKGLGGVMAWSLAEDSVDWSHVKAIREGVEGMTMTINV